MPAESASFLPRERHLDFEQIARLVQIVAPLGLSKLRLTGGEPLLRPNLDQLIAKLAGSRGVEEVALTTNGILLTEQLPDLVRAGIGRINISLDTLREDTFQRLSRRAGLDRVLQGISAALDAPQVTVRLNSLVLRDVNLDDVVSLVEFARERGITLRFIEFMPLDASRKWSEQRMVSGAELRSVIADRFGELRTAEVSDPSQPATDYLLPGGGRVGFIDTVTKPFCRNCDRLRLTSDGKLRNCLFSQQEWELGSLLRASAASVEIERVVRACLSAKHPSHGIAESGFQPPARAMYQIGG